MHRVHVFDRAEPSLHSDLYHSRRHRIVQLHPRTRAVLLGLPTQNVILAKDTASLASLWDILFPAAFLSFSLSFFMEIISPFSSGDQLCIRPFWIPLPLWAATVRPRGFLTFCSHLFFSVCFGEFLQNDQSSSEREHISKFSGWGMNSVSVLPTPLRVCVRECVRACVCVCLCVRVSVCYI